MKRFAITLLLFFTCLALAACGASAPDVKGKTVAQAEELMLAAGFRVSTVTYDESATDPAGSIVSQTTQEGSAVVLIVAGPAPVSVPTVLGLDEDGARALLNTMGLELGGVTRSYDASVPTGVVASQAPSVGSSAAKGSEVAVVISKGPEPVAVPSVKGRTQAAATALLRSAGFKVKVVKKANRAKKGTVFAQQPAGGNVRPGTTVEISVSTGVVMVQVPELVGLYADSRGVYYTALDAGVKLRYAGVQGSAGQYQVISRLSPKAGSWIPKGGTVMYWTQPDFY